MLTSKTLPLTSPNHFGKSNVFILSPQKTVRVGTFKNNSQSACLKSSLQSITTAQEVDKSSTSAKDRVEILSEALPFIQKFRGKTIVVKYGGAAMKSEALRASVIADIVLLSCVGLRIVFVHGGGPEINQYIIDGRLKHSPLLEILTDEGAGTMITG